jgi:hypothetical protein
MAHYHAVVWLDHHEAKVFHFSYDHVEGLRVMPAKPNVHLHHHHDPALRQKLAGVETVDHPSDKQLVAHARRYFLATDRKKPQRG